MLAFDVRKIELAGPIFRKNKILPDHLQLALLGKKFEGLTQVRHPINFDAVHHRSLARVRLRNNYGFLALPARLDSDRQRPLDGRTSIERKFTAIKQRASEACLSLGPLLPSLRRSAGRSSVLPFSSNPQVPG